MPGGGALFVAGCLVAVCTLPACADAERTAEPLAPVLLVGVDGLEWNVLRPLLADGRCPNLRALMERGTFGRLGTMVPTLSPILWTTIATGKMPQYHGIKGFLDQENRTYTSSRRTCRALWNIADRYGLSSQVVGWWTTWPVEPIRGLMVSGTSSGAMLDVNWKPTLIPGAERQVYPPEREAALIGLAEEVGSEQRVLALSREIFGELPPAEMGIVESEILLPETLWSLQADATYHALMCDVLRDGVADLNMVYFGSPDVAGHRFWRYWEPAPYEWPDNPAVDELIRDKVTRFDPFKDIEFESVRDLVADRAGDERLAHVLPNIYEWFDAMLGELLDIVGEEVTVIVVSDHGMHAVSTEAPTAKFVTGHHQDGAPGVLVAAGPGIARSGDVEAFLADGTLTTQGSLLNVTPTVLALLGIPPDELQAERGAHRPMLTAPAQERSRMPPVSSHDEGFRAATDEALPAEMDDAFKERFRGLGYLGEEGEAMESAVNGDVQLVNPEGFEPDTEFSVEEDG
jgi:hypothetical protein